MGDSKLNYKHHLLFVMTIHVMILADLSPAQIGIGATGDVHYPGLQKSDPSKNQFDPGFGYGFHVRHDLFALNKPWKTHLRYSFRFLSNKLKRPGKINADFDFIRFSADFLLARELKQWHPYFGLSAILISADGKMKYREFSDQKVIPALFFGTDYIFSAYYRAYIEIAGQIGELSINPERQPLHGFGLTLGLQMFITDQEATSK
ncbi:MAG: hypothetical protein GF313_07790 [Caldithrix sp.]|nr:hypothetical protein [Caldithrix sp.]